MPSKTFNARIKCKRDTSANWTQNNPVLLYGEIILVDTSTGELRAKVGDGVKTYTQLPFSDEVLRSLIDNKVDKVDGKGLSTNDYTTEEKNKLAGIANGATKVTVDSALSSTSTNPVQNKVVNAAISDLNSLIDDTSVSISNKADINHTHDDMSTITIKTWTSADMVEVG